MLKQEKILHSILGNTNLDFGSNQIEIIVEAEDKTTSSYIINVTRKEYDIATLDDIKVDGISVKNFNKDTFEYTLDSVEFNKKDINIETSKTNSYATVKGDGNVTLKTGNNEILITVTAQNGTEKVYKLNITVEDQKPIKVTIDKANYTIVKKNHDETIKPENFEETTIKIDDQDVIAYVNKKSNLTLVVLKNNQGKTGLYVYDAKKKSYTPYKVLKVGNLTLDCTTFELSSPTDSCRLPNKEFQIMELLAANSRQIISTDRFMEKVWGYDSEADVGVVWVYISYLRKKLVSLDANVKIKAARGQGYYLEIQP